MGLELSLDDIRRAWDARDPDLANLIVTLVAAPDGRVGTYRVPTRVAPARATAGRRRSWAPATRPRP